MYIISTVFTAVLIVRTRRSIKKKKWSWKSTRQKRSCSPGSSANDQNRTRSGQSLQPPRCDRAIGVVLNIVSFFSKYRKVELSTYRTYRASFGRKNPPASPVFFMQIDIYRTKAFGVVSNIDIGIVTKSIFYPLFIGIVSNSIPISVLYRNRMFIGIALNSIIYRYPDSIIIGIVSNSIVYRYRIELDSDIGIELDSPSKSDTKP